MAVTKVQVSRFNHIVVSVVTLIEFKNLKYICILFSDTRTGQLSDFCVNCGSLIKAILGHIFKKQVLHSLSKKFGHPLLSDTLLGSILNCYFFFF